jgi:hypothetical protein
MKGTKVMKNTITKEWLLERLALLNAKELEHQAGLGRGRIHDVKRGRVTLKVWELEAITEVMRGLEI